MNNARESISHHLVNTALYELKPVFRQQPVKVRRFGGAGISAPEQGQFGVLPEPGEAASWLRYPLLRPDRPASPVPGSTVALAAAPPSRSRALNKCRMASCGIVLAYKLHIEPSYGYRVAAVDRGPGQLISRNSAPCVGFRADPRPLHPAPRSMEVPAFRDDAHVTGVVRCGRGHRRAGPVRVERGRSGTTGGKAQEHVRAVFQTPGHHMDDLHVALHMALDRQQPGLHDGLAVVRHHLGPHDEIGDPGLVLKGDEANALGTARPLPDQDQARKLDHIARCGCA